MLASLMNNIPPQYAIRSFRASVARPIGFHTSAQGVCYKDSLCGGLKSHFMPSLSGTYPLLFVTRGPCLDTRHGTQKEEIWNAQRSRSKALYCTITPQRKNPQPSVTRPPSPTRCRETTKRKVALFVGYDGTPYKGFQRNAGVSTVSDALEHALHAARAISDENFGFLNKIKWQVAARTDRGVGALGNLVSAKLLFNRDELSDGSAFSATTDRVNEQLPPHIRLFGIQRITNSFNARSCCEARWYEYMLPMSTLGKRPEALSDFNTIIKSFVGSHYFHNYTIGAEHTIPPTVKARRYILECFCDETPVVIDSGRDSSSTDELETRFVRIMLRGQSFMMHQIRKMISLALLTYLGHVPNDAIARSFLPETLINVPPAPPQGLFLDCCRFGWYNERQEDALPEPLDMNAFAEQREHFKISYLLPSISKRFQEDDSFEEFFKTAKLHPVQFE